MQISFMILYLCVLASHATLSPLVSCSSHENVKDDQRKNTDIHNLSPKLKSDITLHGFLLWISMGLLMPLAILIIRMSHKEEGRRRKVFFYIHVIMQTLAVLLATAGAILSIKSFPNSFDNNHQRIGLALYGAIWIQAIIGFLRPPRGNKKRSNWYFLHWILGTIVSLAGIINIYTGLNAYQIKMGRSRNLWTILFTTQTSLMAFLYLFQDKWEYMQKQGVSLNDIVDPTLTIPARTNQTPESQKVFEPQPSSKRNALQNLFD